MIMNKKNIKQLENFGRAFSIFMTILTLWLAHNVESLDYEFLDFILPEFNEILMIIDVALGVTIISKLIMIFVQDEGIVRGARMFEIFLSLFLTGTFILRFPFDFTRIIDFDAINTIARVLLVLAYVGLSADLFKFSELRDKSTEDD